MKHILLEYHTLLEASLSEIVQDWTTSNNLYSLISPIVSQGYHKATITDLELPLDKYMSIEEYLDNFVDWVYEISEQDPLPAELQGDISINKLFDYYIHSDEYFDTLKDLINDPSVMEDVRAMQGSENIDSEV